MLPGGGQASTALAPALTAALVNSAAACGSGAPVPAMTGTAGGTAARTASTSATRSPGVSVPASPVVPDTITAFMPRATRSLASPDVAAGSTSPRASNTVTSATPTPLNSSLIAPHPAGDNILAAT